MAVLIRFYSVHIYMYLACCIFSSEDCLSLAKNCKKTVETSGTISSQFPLLSGSVDTAIRTMRNELYSYLTIFDLYQQILEQCINDFRIQLSDSIFLVRMNNPQNCSFDWLSARTNHLRFFLLILSCSTHGSLQSLTFNRVFWLKWYGNRVIAA